MRPFGSVMDKIEKIHGSVVQHGAHNDRIYVLKLEPGTVQELLPCLDSLASENGYGKILVKTPSPLWPAFRECGYVREAVVPGFFKGETDGVFAAKFMSDPNTMEVLDAKLKRLINDEQDADAAFQRAGGAATYQVASCSRSDLPEMCKVYQSVFATYPFPIDRPSYLGQVLNKDALYYCLKAKGVIAAVSAAEIDRKAQNAEMTDFATLPKWRGRRFASRLLKHMESEMAKRKIKVLYTIARADSLAMNLVFKRNGYGYGGVLKNNSQICGRIENMLVWYKHL